jgi:hypothetical protein
VRETKGGHARALLREMFQGGKGFPTQAHGGIAVPGRAESEVERA